MLWSRLCGKLAARSTSHGRSRSRLHQISLPQLPSHQTWRQTLQRTHPRSSRVCVLLLPLVLPRPKEALSPCTSLVQSPVSHLWARLQLAAHHRLLLSPPMAQAAASRPAWPNLCRLPAIPHAQGMTAGFGPVGPQALQWWPAASLQRRLGERPRRAGACCTLPALCGCARQGCLPRPQQPLPDRVTAALAHTKPADELHSSSSSLMAAAMQQL